MDFTDSANEALFRASARDFLQATARRKLRGVAPPGVERFDDPLELASAKAWQAKKMEAGFVGITWEKSVGGRGGSSIEQVIYDQEEAEFVVPSFLFRIGLGMCIPTLIAYATAEQLQRYVPPAMRGDEIWCQLFSEPGAGSDLAGLRTRAVRDGEDWIINGQKIWTSGAHLADFAIIIGRSNFEAPKHAGLTFFFLDMRSPGIEVRPIRQMSGLSRFNEVFLTDVRVPDTQRLGEVGNGWQVAMTTLSHERLAVGDASGPDALDLLALAKQLQIGGRPAIKDRAIREQIGDLIAVSEGLKYAKFRTMTAISQGKIPGPEASIGKILNASKAHAVASAGMDMLGAAGSVLDKGLTPFGGWFQDAFLNSPGSRIGGGTDEILRNVIAERVLGLPAENRADKDAPFNELPKQ